MTNEEAKRKVRGYLTDILPSNCSDEIDEIMQALEPKWIPVSEKLPEEQTHVIVTIGNERFTSTQLCLYTSTSIFWKEYVKAWMPLPEPFKAESEVEK